MNPYDHKKIEKKWQKVWIEKKVYQTLSPEKAKANKMKPYYVLDMFPYPSGVGLHVGHPRGYIGSDVYARMKRMEGFNVLHPMGYDAFGLPAEQYAIENKVHPKTAVEKNIKTFRSQLDKIGFSYDWDRSVNTTDPGYYKWTQWIFLQLYNSYYDEQKNKARPISELIKKMKLEKLPEIERQKVLMNYRLAYEGYSEVNWCPYMGTVLANDEIKEVNGKLVSERGEYPVEKKSMRQWFMRITSYADRLLADLEKLDWPENIKEIQKNWIGKSDGALIDFKIESNNKSKTKYLIFDFDGVLGDTLEETFIAKVEMGDSKTIEEAKKNGLIYHGKKPIHIRGANDNDIRSSADWVLRFGTILQRLKPKIFEGFVKEITKVPNTKIAIVSAGSNLYIDSMVEEIKALGVHPSHVLTFEDHHSKEEKVEMVCKDWKVGVKDIYYFTDSKADIYELEGICDQSKLIGCGWGHMGPEPLLDLIPEHQLLRNFSDIHKIFDEKKITVFTTRADTLFGATYVVLAPEHALVQELKSRIKNWDEVEKYISEVKNKSEEDRVAAGKEKTGVQLQGVMAINPANSEKIPIWIADYVLAGYGTGAIMAVPHHDDRDREFALKYQLPITDKPLVPISEIVSQVKGKLVTKYKMRDAIFARQRYWGEPIPLIHTTNGTIETIPENKLPLKLPNVKSYQPTGTGESPLAGVKEWVNKGYETNTMPGWAGSSWYFLRYTDPKNKKVFASKKNLDYWFNIKKGGVDMYVGGAEHATGHLLYSRFWHKFLYDRGYVATNEPFNALRNQGMIGGADGRKMGKRYGNAVNPDDVIAQFGADSLRVFEMFLGPFESSLPWAADGIVGARRFIEKVWRLQEKINSKNKGDDYKKILHKTIKKVTEDIKNFSFNTAISSMMICVNDLEKSESISGEDFKKFLKILAPFAPYVTEELWNELGEKETIHLVPWPSYDPEFITDETVTLGIQMNGKIRAEITIPTDADETFVRGRVMQIPEVKKWLDGKEVKKFLFIPRKIISIVF